MLAHGILVHHSRDKATGYLREVGTLLYFPAFQLFPSASSLSRVKPATTTWKCQTPYCNYAEFVRNKKKKHIITLFVFSRSNSTDLILSRESISILSFSAGISTGLFLISSYFFSSFWIRSKHGTIRSFIVVSVVGVRVLELEGVMVCFFLESSNGI